MKLMAAIIPLFIHPDFHELFNRMNFIDRLSFLIVHGIDRLGIWHRLPVLLGMIYLGIRRRLLNKYNLINVGENPKCGVMDYKSDEYRYHRSANGSFNDPHNPAAGSESTFFGRNMTPQNQENSLMDPDPMVVATKLLARRKMIDTGKQFNMIGVAWIQMMVHDWIDHMEETDQIEMIAPVEVASVCPLKSFKFHKTKIVPTGQLDIKKGSINIRTPWWDASMLYGSTHERMKKVRTFQDGKLKITNDGLLLYDEQGVAISGDVRNSWVGVSALHILFIMEHNVICDALKKEYPELDDEALYRHARLVTSAVIAKIHTIDWTIELLKTDTMVGAMRNNWYGFLGKRLKDTFGHTGHPLMSGFLGMKKAENHGVPYSLTEEFSSVYRMHPLLPDNLIIRDIHSLPSDQSLPPPQLKEVPMKDMVGLPGEKLLAEIGLTTLLVSLGHQPSGALELWNHPLWMRNLTTHNVDGTERPGFIDLIALDVYRDRERNVPRYNEFRRKLFMVPMEKWEDITDDKEAIKVLREVYSDDIEKIDLMVGLLAEKKIKGFAISETAFILFVMMASRRLEADRFFTSEFNEKAYTKKGLEWVNTTESLKDVFLRHFTKHTETWMKSTSAFTVWNAPPNVYNPVPLYLRLPS